MELLEIKDELILPHILSFLTFDEIAKNRIVCRAFNEVCWSLLNKGFRAAEKYQTNALKAVKLQLPRRESERRKHPLSKKCDILVAIETRLSMLSMAFSRYIESKLCCFIPGKVIDELFSVMRALNNCPDVQPTHMILQELRDVSTMAMEHFDDKVVPSLRQKEQLEMQIRMGAIGGPPKYKMSALSNELCSRPLPRHTISKMIDEYCSQINKNKQIHGYQRPEDVKKTDINKVVRRQNRKIKDLEMTVKEQNKRLCNNEIVINEMKKMLDDLKNKKKDPLPSSSLEGESCEPWSKKRKTEK